MRPGDRRLEFARGVGAPPIRFHVGKEHSRLLKLREKRVRKKMGVLRYLCCPAQRAAFRKLFPITSQRNNRDS